MGGGRPEIFHVKGMFCEHCEQRIEAEVGALPGVQEVHASFPKGTVQVLPEPGSDAGVRAGICAAIERAGYEVTDREATRPGGAETPAGRSGMGAPIGRGVQTASILIILLGLYLIVRHLGWMKVFNIFPRVEEGLGLGMVFVIGLLTSVHCIAMCGGINLTQSTLSVQWGSRILRANAGYNLGRMISYTIIGGIAGGIGSVLSLGGMLRGAVAILAGVIMVLMALRMLGLFRAFPGLRLHLPAGLYEKAAGLAFGRGAKAGGGGAGGGGENAGYASTGGGGVKTSRGSSSLVIGLLNGLMPCGPLQAMQIYALSTGSVWLGALSMLLFAAGTVPLMFGFGAFAGRLNQKYSRYVLTVSALLIFVMGIHMAGTGFALSGARLPSFGNGLSSSGNGQPTSESGLSSSESESPMNDASGPMASVSGNRQRITTEIDYGEYPSFTVRAGIPVEWTIHVPKGKLNGCNGEIIVPAYDLDVVLSEGDNTVEFTPAEAGDIPYSCWMGMIRSTIRVVE